MNLSVYTDGGALNNPGPAASAYLVYQGTKLLVKGNKAIGINTNNIAEYTALILALQKLKELKSNGLIPPTANIVCYSDSLLMVSQLNGAYKIKNAQIKKLVAMVHRLKEEVAVPVSHAHIPREKNQEADDLVKQILIPGSEPA